MIFFVSIKRRFHHRGHKDPEKSAVTVLLFSQPHALENISLMPVFSVPSRLCGDFFSCWLTQATWSNEEMRGRGPIVMHMTARDRFMRRALWATAVFNAGGAFLFAFPSSLPGQLAGLPPDVPPVYRALVTLFVLMFGGAYAWLATQTKIDRPAVAFFAIGKSAAFTIVLCLWLMGAAAARSVLAVSGDLAFAAIFAWWLAGD